MSQISMVFSLLRGPFIASVCPSGLNLTAYTSLWVVLNVRFIFCLLMSHTRIVPLLLADIRVVLSGENTIASIPVDPTKVGLYFGFSVLINSPVSVFQRLILSLPP